MNNNSYVCIPADKLVEIIKGSCPPVTELEKCFFTFEGDCVTCWKSWLKDGESKI